MSSVLSDCIGDRDVGQTDFYVRIIRVLFTLTHKSASHETFVRIKKQRMWPFLRLIRVTPEEPLKKDTKGSEKDTKGSGLIELRPDPFLIDPRQNKRVGKEAVELFRAYSAVSDTAARLGKLQLAESWLNESSALIGESPEAFKNGEADVVATRLADVRMRAGHPSNETGVPRLTDVMFFLF